ncbi:MAG: FG-GAP-like repeat-containing protein [Verrucomicrobiales bacterium]
MDPTRDGWETEAFSAEAAAQLQALKSLLTASAEITAQPLAALALADIRVAPLRPADTSEVFRHGPWLVRRAKEPGPPQSGLDRLATALNDLRRGATQVDPLLKVFRVSRLDATEVETAVVVSIGLHSAADRRQINGEWTCRWRTSKGSPPLLAAIVPASHEEVIYESSQLLFADATAALLGDSAAYRNQWLVPSDHWRARLPRALGLDPVANHGLAIGDVNGDHLDDLYVCQQGGLPNRLYLQRANGTLEDVSGVSGADWLDYCAAALFIDLDNDGDRDLVISQDFRILFMANDGSGRFALATVAATKAQSFSLAAADYDRDGWVDVYVCGYNPSTAALRGGAMGEPMPFHDANNGGENILWRNQGGFRFVDVTADVGLNVNNTRYSFAAAWEDYDNDGDQDLYLANDYGRNNLYRNDGGRFTDVAGTLGVEDTASGMSVSWSDFNHDGLMDLYVSNMFSSAKAWSPTPGRPTLINLWATWCNPCLQELSAWASERDAFQSAGLDIVLFNTDALGAEGAKDKAAIETVLAKTGAPFAHHRITLNGLHALDHLNRSVLDRWQPLPLPTSFLIDSQGELALIYKGPVAPAQIIADLGVAAGNTEARRAAATPFPGRWVGAEGPVADPKRVASLMLDHDDVSSAIAYLDRCLQLLAQNPATASSQRELADLQYMAGLLKRGNASGPAGAVASLAAARDLGPNDIRVRRELAQALFAAGRTEEAATELRAALRINPADLNVKNELADLNLRLGNLNQARSLLEEIIAAQPKDGLSRYRLAGVLDQSGEASAAIEAYRQTLRDSPRLLEAANDLAKLLATHPDPAIRSAQEAKALAQRLCAISQEKDPRFLETFGLALANNQEFPAAIEAATKAIQLLPAENAAARTTLQSHLDAYSRQEPVRR